MRILCLCFALWPAVCAAQTLQILHRFPDAPRSPLGGLIRLSDGSLVGTTSEGGNGSIYRVSPGGVVTTVHRFADGSHPVSALTVAANGGIYGTTTAGGPSGNGTLFRFDPVAGTVTTVHAFSHAADGVSPYGPLLSAGDGLIYGTTRTGTIFRLDPQSETVRNIARLPSTGELGTVVESGLIEGVDGFLYGTAQGGGATGGGTIFRVDPASGVGSLVHAFSLTNDSPGYSPGQLVRTQDGRIYGATWYGGEELAGALFRFAPESGTVTYLHVIRPSAGEGRVPAAAMVEGTDGHLYGVTLTIPINVDDGGTVFRLSRLPGETYAFAPLFSLNRHVQGSGVLGRLLATPDGWLHGITSNGGPSFGGTLFRFDSLARGGPSDPNQLTVVHAFGASTGYLPTGAPTQAADGHLYGLTGRGGAANLGQLYRLNATTGRVTLLGDVPGPPTAGGASNSALVTGPGGVLFGTSTRYLSETTAFEGRVLRIDPAAGTVTIVATVAEALGDIARIADGTLFVRTSQTAIARLDLGAGTLVPVATLPAAWFPYVHPMIVGNDGRLYAFVRSTVFAGRFVFRTLYTLYRIDPATGVVAEVHSATEPVSSTVRDAAGRVVMLAASGATQRLDTYDPATATFSAGTVPITSNPGALLAADASGSLYAGQYDQTLRRLDPLSGQQQVLHTFTDADGTIQGLALSPDGHLYGATSGALFRLGAQGAPPAPLDGDTDGLSDAWETQFGLDPLSDTDGGAADSDGDGVPNVTERDQGTHPRGVVARYLAEGATGSFFRTEIALFNPTAQQARVLVRFLTDAGTTVTRFFVLGGMARETIDVATVPGLASANFATVVESDVLVVVDRTMRWDASGFGSHAETAVTSPATTWHLAEGSTSDPFSLFYLLQNAQAVPVTATIRYLRPGGLPAIERTYVLRPNSRTTIPVDLQGPELASTDLGATITASLPIIAERAMYMSHPDQPFAAGHSSAGVTAPATEWFLAEGATGTFFDLFVLVANPTASPASITAEFLLPNGTRLRRDFSIAPEGRLTLWVDELELPAGGGQRPLAATSVSTTIRSTNQVPVIVERTMWWPGPETSAAFWREASNAPGATITASRWALAGPAQGGPSAADTFVLIANPNPVEVHAVVQVRGAVTFPLEHHVTLPPTSRTTVSLAVALPDTAGKPFGLIVQSTDLSRPPLVVERAMYESPGSAFWAAGTAILASPIP